NLDLVRDPAGAHRGVETVPGHGAGQTKPLLRRAGEDPPPRDPRGAVPDRVDRCRAVSVRASRGDRSRVGLPGPRQPVGPIRVLPAGDLRIEKEASLRIELGHAAELTPADERVAVVEALRV